MSFTSAWGSKLLLNMGTWMGSLSDIAGGPAPPQRAMSATRPTFRQEVISNYFYSLPHTHWFSQSRLGPLLSRCSLIGLLHLPYPTSSHSLFPQPLVGVGLEFI